MDPDSSRPSWWSLYLIERPTWFSDSFDHFRNAVTIAVADNIKETLEALDATRSKEIQVWFHCLAQNAGTSRIKECRSRGSGGEKIPVKERKPGRVSVALAREVLERDGYRCRYCQAPVVFNKELKKFQKIVGRENFPIMKDNLITHGITRVFYNSFDHVVPRSRGGSNDASNLVAACYPCNFGKADWTLKQLGLEDPRDRPVLEDLTWKGLTDAFG